MTRRLILALALLGLSGPVYAEDTAAVLAAMPNKAADLRYLKQLCDKAGVAERDYLAAEADVVACYNRDCSQAEAAGANATKQIRSSYQGVAIHDRRVALDAYKAKRGTDPPPCADDSKESVDRYIAALRATNEAMDRRLKRLRGQR